MLDAPWKGKPSQEVSKVVRQGEKLKPYLIVTEIPARKPCPPHRVLAFPYPLLCGAALVVKMDDVLWPTGHVGYNEPYARE